MKISKLDAAQIQLDAAIVHFFDNEHVPSVTLAGAAEDLLSGLLKAAGKQTAFEFLHKWYEETYETKVPTKTFSHQIANSARNWLKHANDDSDTCTTISEQDSIMMLMRALPCYFKLTQKHTAQMDRFFNYIRNNISDINKMFS